MSRTSFRPPCRTFLVGLVSNWDVPGRESHLQLQIVETNEYEHPVPEASCGMIVAANVSEHVCRP